MSTSNLIRGLTLLQKYRAKDGCNFGGEHDVIWASPTDRPLTNDHIQVMIDAGWHQEVAGRDDGEEFSAKHYDEEESWGFYT